MKAAIVVLTEHGLRTACRILENWSSQETPELWLSWRINGQGLASWKPQPFKKLSDLVPELWKKCALFIFIMATGIVVRQIAPLLKGKDRDPAVLVLDEKGKYVISLLSGHLGGANTWAKTVAQWLNAQPVITTATDVQGLIAPDEYARRFNWCVDPVTGLKEVNSFLLEHGQLKVWTDYLPKEHPLRQDINYIFLKKQEKAEAHIWITTQDIHSSPNKPIPLLLVPRIYSVGIGCRRGVSKEQINEAVRRSLELIGVSIKSVKGLFSIDLKADEIGIREVAQDLKISYRTFTAAQIQEINEQRGLVPSEYVKEKIGVDGVCEAASLLGANRGELVLTKQKLDGVTVAISKEKSMW